VHGPLAPAAFPGKHRAAAAPGGGRDTPFPCHGAIAMPDELARPQDA